VVVVVVVVAVVVVVVVVVVVARQDSNCLLSSAAAPPISAPMLPGQLFNPDTQCQIMLGVGSFYCGVSIARVLSLIDDGGGGSSENTRI